MNRILGLFRHGDYDRSSGQLTSEGEGRLVSVVDSSFEAGRIPDLVLHSTVTRAVQSATTVHARFAALSGRNPKIASCEAFNENRSFCTDGMIAIAQAVQSLPLEHHCIFVVTHLPEIMQIGRMFNCGFPSVDKAELLTIDFGNMAWNDMQLCENRAGDVFLCADPVSGGISRFTPSASIAAGGRVRGGQSKPLMP